MIAPLFVLMLTAQPVDEQPKPIETTLSELVVVERRNVALMDEKFVGKYVSIRAKLFTLKRQAQSSQGYVLTLVQYPDPKTRFQRGAMSSDGFIQAYFELGRRSQLAKLTLGQTVTVTGILIADDSPQIPRQVLSMKLVDCKIVEEKPVEPAGDLKSDQAKLEQQNREAMLKIEEAKKQIEQAEKAKKQIIEFQEMVNKAKNKIDDLQAQLKTATGDERKKLQMKIDQIKQELKELVGQLQKMNIANFDENWDKIKESTNKQYEELKKSIKD